MNRFTLGALVRLAVEFNVNGTPTDPTAVTFKVRVPAGTVTTYVYGTDAQLVKASAGTVIRDADGNAVWTAAASGTYYVDYPTAAEGIHWWRMQGTGTAVGAEEQAFTVKDSRFT